MTSEHPSSVEELSLWTGEPLAELLLWQSIGLLPDAPTIPLPQRLERVRLIRFAVQRGYEPQHLAEIASAHGDMIGHFAEQIGAMVGEPVCSAAEAAERAGVDPSLLERLGVASGLGDQPFAVEADLRLAALLKTVVDLGLPSEVLTQMLRVIADSTYKIADAGSRLFHLHVHEQMRTAGAGGIELLSRTMDSAGPLLGLVEPAVMYYHQKAWQRALREDMMLHLAEDSTMPSGMPGEFTRAFLFIDLAGFTPMTEAMGDAASAEVIDRFSKLVRDGAGHCSGQVIKQMGDAFMLVFPDGYFAARCGLAILQSARAETRFPALRLGAHVGPVLYREGDYLGTAVNTAARVAAVATRHQFLVTDAVRAQLDRLDVEIIDAGARALKGLADPVQLFELRSLDSERPKVVDPVCGMELDEGSAEANLIWQGLRVLLCSEQCLRRFLDEPNKYESALAEPTT